jgi:hypothetical protein
METLNHTWPDVAYALVMMLPPTVAGLLAWYQTKRTHGMVNAKMAELLTVSKTAARKGGILDEQFAQRERADGDLTSDSSHPAPQSTRLADIEVVRKLDAQR